MCEAFSRWHLWLKRNRRPVAVFKLFVACISNLVQSNFYNSRKKRYQWTSSAISAAQRLLYSMCYPTDARKPLSIRLPIVVRFLQSTFRLFCSVSIVVELTNIQVAFSTVRSGLLTAVTKPEAILISHEKNFTLSQSLKPGLMKQAKPLMRRFKYISTVEWNEFFQSQHRLEIAGETCR